MKFVKLRLSGFKSFVEPVEFQIHPGLTGIVGPNGCGKSNLLEAVRWVMGESSYKSLRGTEMEDVVFAGTAGRPAHNLAEVCLIIDNKTRTAPSAFNDGDTIEISRRIERDAGSVYRINGRDVRARDVQLFFADAATGAHSPALVRQGQINAIISAKPFERRRVLEEAAGISGLYSRRHEAELKLRAAQNNLSRLADSTEHLASRVRSLKRQARQAVRYRTVSEEIHHTESILLVLRRNAAQEDVAGHEISCGQAQDETQRLTTAAARAARHETDSAAQIPALREKEASALAVFHRLKAACENLDKEEERFFELLENCKTQIKQMKNDETQARTTFVETQKTLAKLEEEQKGLKETTGTKEEAEAHVVVCQQHLQVCENTLERLARDFTAYEARHGRLQEVLREIQHKDEQVREELENLEQERKLLDKSDVTAQRDAVRRLEAILREKAQKIVQAQEVLVFARAEEQDAAVPRDKARQVLARLEAEQGAIKGFLGEQKGGLFDQVHVAAGFEKAVGAALGDDLLASVQKTDEEPYWCFLPPLSVEGLPKKIRPLSEVVRGPDFLQRRLFATGIVERSQGARLQKILAPGQRLVSCEGDLWRWDGYCASAQASAGAARRVVFQKRLRELQKAFAGTRKSYEQACRRYEEAQNRVLGAQERDKSARTRWSEVELQVQAARNALGGAEAKAQETKAQSARLQEALGRLQKTRATLHKARGEQEHALTALKKDAPSQDALGAARRDVEEARTALSQAQAAAQTFVQEQELRATRKNTLAKDKVAWQNHARTTQTQIDALQARQKEIQERQKKLFEKLRTTDTQRNSLLDKVAQAEHKGRSATNALRAQEAELAKYAKAARSADAALAQAREVQARQETVLETANARLAEAQEAIHAFGADVELGDETRTFEEVQQELQRLKRERDNLGMVNLAAEQEMKEAQKTLEVQTAEQKDLLRAINRLRHAIRKLNKEGRARLLQAFEVVNGHFGVLFTRLFGGGKAHLKLVESEDPLEAGLEIMVRPPGKRLERLSLLSGGEQTLSAIALMFAVFLTNPAPICILDEVDAPLDDANVERFCDLLRDMSTTRETRFLIITHHALTMARMGRLFGVTMPERGVSQIVSVDLSTASQYAQTGPQAGLSAAQ